MPYSCKTTVSSDLFTLILPFHSIYLSLPKMLSGANAFEISDIERMNIGAHQPGVRT